MTIQRTPEQPKQRDRNVTQTNTCPRCGVSVKYLKDHISNCHSDYQCNLCSKAFGNLESLLKHKELHEQNAFPCEKCNLSFKTSIALALHARTHFVSTTYKCSKCDFKTQSKVIYQLHSTRHEKSEKDWFTCNLCDKGFVSKQNRDDHVASHTGIKRYECDICSKIFLCHRYLLSHRRLNHRAIITGEDSDALFECQKCNRKFTFKKSLVRHLSRIHNIGKDWSVSCELCSRKLSNPHSLKIHMRTHSGERPFVCEFCGSSYVRNVGLLRHKISAHSQRHKKENDEVVNS